MRLNSDFCLNYLGRTSPAIYMREGNFFQHANSHRKWESELKDLVGKFSFQVFIANPRVQGNLDAYRDTEAIHIDYFINNHGATPLWNKQCERKGCLHYSYSEPSIREALNKRSGAKYKWANLRLFTLTFESTDEGK